MIRRASECKPEYREHMRGGAGTVKMTSYVTKEELYNKGRLFGDITLEPGCGIGAHVHEGEEEIFVVTRGTVIYNDNGTEHTATVGDILICNDGETHSIRNEGTAPASVTALIVLR